jgi:hypothetical protein
MGKSIDGWDVGSVRVRLLYKDFQQMSLVNDDKILGDRSKPIL